MRLAWFAVVPLVLPLLPSNVRPAAGSAEDPEQSSTLAYPTVSAATHLNIPRMEADLRLEIRGEIPRGATTRIRVWAGANAAPPSVTAPPAIDERPLSLPWRLTPDRTAPLVSDPATGALSVPITVSLLFDSPTGSQDYSFVRFLPVAQTGWKKIRSAPMIPGASGFTSMVDPIEVPEGLAIDSPSRTDVQPMNPQPEVTGTGEFKPVQDKLVHKATVAIGLKGAYERVTNQEFWVGTGTEPPANRVPNSSLGTITATQIPGQEWRLTTDVTDLDQEYLWLHCRLTIEDTRFGTSAQYWYRLEPTQQVVPDATWHAEDDTNTYFQLSY